MEQRILDIADHLLLIERELKVQGWWSDATPSAEALASVVPFAVDSMAFEQWLQWIFLPRMKLIIESNGTLPVRSGIRPMAEVVYQGDLDPVLPLLASLAEFDRLIESA